MSKEAATSSGTSISTILFVVFLVLKLCDKIAWSWWWVCAPLWIPVVVLLFIMFSLLLVAALSEVFDK